jgi:hypothetical protein
MGMEPSLTTWKDGQQKSHETNFKICTRTFLQQSVQLTPEQISEE